jgi:release factor glutamine methyltransferase
MAVHAPSSTIHAVDMSAEALTLARENAARHHVANRIRFYHGDGFSPLDAGARFDLIVSNPPYIPSAEISQLQPEVRDFDPRLALDGGADGMDFYRRLAAESAMFLQPSGQLLLEFGDGQAEALRKLFSDEKWIVDEIVADYSARPRILVARRQDT